VMLLNIYASLIVTRGLHLIFLIFAAYYRQDPGQTKGMRMQDMR
jgi:hypothetical protein